MIHSPAAQILNTSEHLWVTIHEDNILRLWNFSDGRCVASSTPDLLYTPIKKILALPSNGRGIIICIGLQGDIYLVNVF